ncbi:hypothetical protein JCM8097_001651 [Rhodosporidiobolus ruineniae]
MRRPSLRSRLSSRFSASAPSLPPEQTSDHFLPVELVLRIIDEALLSCETDKQRDQFRARLRRVNRTFSTLFKRTKFHMIAFSGGEALPELLAHLKDDPDLAITLEGVSLRNMVPYDSRVRLERDWVKLRKICPRLECLQLGDPEVRPKAWAGVPGHVLHGMKGLSSIRLVSLELANTPPPRTFFRRSPPLTPILPSGLRHLSLSSVDLRDLSLSPIPTFWPQMPLVTLSLSDLCDADSRTGDSLLLACIRSLLEQCAPTLQALHYSRRRLSPADEPNDPRPQPSILADLAFPSLRILSVSLAHFPPASPFLLQSAPKLEYLTLTLCDLLLTGHRHLPRALASFAAFDGLDEVFGPPALLPAGEDADGAELVPSSPPPLSLAKVHNLPLKVLELPRRARVGFMEQETSMYARVEQRRREVIEAVRALGVDAKEVVYEKAEVEERFRRRVREVLGERL